MAARSDRRTTATTAISKTRATPRISGSTIYSSSAEPPKRAACGCFSTARSRSSPVDFSGHRTTRESSQISRSRWRAGDRLLLSADFLVELDRRRAVEDALQSAEKLLHRRALAVSIECVGVGVSLVEQIGAAVFATAMHEIDERTRLLSRDEIDLLSKRRFGVRFASGLHLELGDDDHSSPPSRVRCFRSRGSGERR